MKLIIAEKPSLAKGIAEGLGGARRGALFEARGYTITHAFGHILEQDEPDAYLPAGVPVNPRTGKKVWRLEDLPIFPERWVKHPKKEAKAQLTVIKGLLKQATLVVNAGDPDREGQLLIDEILDYCRYKGSVQRVWLASLDGVSVQKAFAQLKDNRAYHPLSQAAEARARADWLVGMNLTRAWTIANRGLLSVGRVQTPTLALVVRRDREIEQFKPRDYCEVLIHCRHPNGMFAAKWKPTATEGAGFDEEGRLTDRALADGIARKAVGAGQVARYESKDSRESAPLPFSLSSLQKAASAQWGLSANAVLEACQALYEKKLTTYPRTDCRYVPEEQHDEASAILAYLPIPEALRGRVVPHQKHAAWNTAKVTAHHAIIPTGQKASGLSDTERKIYDLIWQSYAALFLPDHRYQAIAVTVSVGGEVWTASGRTETDPGWKALRPGRELADETGEPSAVLPAMAAGDAVEGLRGEVRAKQTKPPPRFTDGTLIEAMSHIHKYVTDPAAKAKLKETSGIGTEATRANVLETLVRRGFVDRKGKQLISTPTGRALIAALPADLTDPVTTARWEDALSHIAEGKLDPARFEAAIRQMVKAQLSQVTAGVSVAGDSSSPKARARPSPSQGAGPTRPCSVAGCSGQIRRLASRNKAGVYFWACSERAHPHALLADHNGVPGEPFANPPSSKSQKTNRPKAARAARMRASRGPQ